MEFDWKQNKGGKNLEIEEKAIVPNSIQLHRNIYIISKLKSLKKEMKINNS